MKYMGSKARHAKELLPIILANRTEGQWYVEPFVGGANMIDKVDGNRIGADLHTSLIEMWQSVSNGWLPPEQVSEGMYREAKSLPESALKGYIGFAMSFSGKWFGGYRRDSVGKRDYSLEAYKDTTKYKDSFDHEPFYEWCRQKHKEGHQVFVSEYQMPDDFTCVWSKEVNSSLTKETGSKKATEKLFTLKSVGQ